MASALDHDRPRVRLTPSWVALVAFVVAGEVGAVYWIAPTWLRVARVLNAPHMASPDPALKVNEPAPSVQEPSVPKPTLDGAGAVDARLAATRALLQLWSVPAEKLNSGDPSRLIREAGLRSTTLPLSWDLLERLDYPCLVVWKKTETAPPRTVALVGLSRTEATVLDPLAGRQRVLSRQELLRQVEGTAQVLWKGAPGLTTPLKPKRGKNPAVAVLQQALKDQGFYQGKAHGVYDAATRASVIKLQAAFGIRKTGVFGVRSHIALAKRMLGAEAPSLASPR